jgi:uncharacterized protein (UPF0264 family)
MTGLLVSVRDAEEAREALRGGASVIDVKEPAAGSLGAASSDTIRQVVSAVAERAPVSVALGELLHETPPAVPDGVTFAKTGLSGIRSVADWGTRWQRRLRQLPTRVTPVAVLYADWRVAASPSPAELLPEADRAGCRVLLVDTFDKRGGNLFQHLPPATLRPWIEEARRRGWKVVLAGSLDLDSLASAVALRPDLIAVRGAASHPDRNGQVSAARVSELVVAIDELRKSRCFA